VTWFTGKAPCVSYSIFLVRNKLSLWCLNAARRHTRPAGVCLLAFGIVLAGNVGSMSGASAGEPHPETATVDGQRATFIREFSGPDDVVKGLPPIVDRSMDILFGRADAKPVGEKMSRPYSVATDSAHRIYVTDPSQGLVHIFDFEKNRYSFLGGAGSRLRTPVGLAIDEDDNLYVTDSVLGLVLVFEPSGKFLKYLGKVGGDEPYFASPSGIAIDRETHHIFVCDPPRHMVVLLDKQGHILGHFGTSRVSSATRRESRFPEAMSLCLIQGIPACRFSIWMGITGERSGYRNSALKPALRSMRRRGFMLAISRWMPSMFSATKGNSSIASAHLAKIAGSSTALVASGLIRGTPSM